MVVAVHGRLGSHGTGRLVVRFLALKLAGGISIKLGASSREKIQERSLKDRSINRVKAEKFWIALSRVNAIKSIANHPCQPMPEVERQSSTIQTLTEQGNKV